MEEGQNTRKTIMKKIIQSLAVAAIFLFSISTLWGYIGHTSSVQRNIERGAYIAKSPVKPGDLKHLPVPLTNEDYALLQCIDDKTSIVIGIFRNGHRRLVLIQDKNSDGLVDRIVTYYIDLNRYKYSARPGAAYPREKFKKLKEDILTGQQGEITPNREGLKYINALQKNSGLVQRWRNGFRIFLKDEIDDMTDRMNFYASMNPKGADLIYQINYRNAGVARVSPIINYTVFCKNSKDRYIKKMTRQIIKNASSHSPRTD